MTVTHPMECVNTCPVRDANPFFHLVEAAAMLVGYNSVKLLSHFAKNMKTFSDNGTSYNAFYGSRVRYPFDQLTAVIRELAAKPDSRQCVVTLWDPEDLQRDTKDKACNLMMLFSINPEGKVNMTTFNRSNDAIWGICTGANIVHLPFFQEYVAISLGRAVGSWTHVTNNLHVYTENPQWEALLSAVPVNFYSENPTTCVFSLDWGIDYGYEHKMDPDYKGRAILANIANTLTVFTQSIDKPTGKILERVNVRGYPHVPWVDRVLIPMLEAWQLRKMDEEHGVVIQKLNEVAAVDWRHAAKQWVERRFVKGNLA